MTVKRQAIHQDSMKTGEGEAIKHSHGGSLSTGSATAALWVPGGSEYDLVVITDTLSQAVNREEWGVWVIM